eukprot:TRINITY_DN32655_c0_g1_i3.p1 TRINITY_DN32655_c0_g1~~TRINITY_DN32655_c0_g1_i3.p1  ORF type:complete len:545 (+),score=123.23 TRINITY_DN32655_c0_g1_i3:88-1722(+)
MRCGPAAAACWAVCQAAAAAGAAGAVPRCAVHSDTVTGTGSLRALKARGPELCCAACAKEAQCVAFTFIRSWDSLCMLKGNALQKRASVGRESATIRAAPGRAPGCSCPLPPQPPPELPPRAAVLAAMTWPPRTAQQAAAPAAAPGWTPPPRSSGYVRAAGCSTRSGLNNQRQALMLALVFAVLLNRTLVAGPYIVNTHDKGKFVPFSGKGSWDNLTRVEPIGRYIDISRMRTALPVPVVEWQDALASGLVSPSENTQFGAYFERHPDEIDHQLPPTQGISLLRDGALLAAGGARGVRLWCQHCWGSPHLRLLFGSSPALYRWADGLWRDALHFSPEIRDAGAAIAAAAQSGAGQGAVHAIHLRVKGTTDYLPTPYYPLIDCAANDLAGARCNHPDACACKPNWQMPPVDHTFVVDAAAKKGRVRPGDTMLLLTNNASSGRVRNVELLLRGNGISPIYPSQMPEVAPLLAGLTGVQRGAAELVAASLATGQFYATCGSTWSEFVLDLRRWAGATSDAARGRGHCTPPHSSARSLSMLRLWPSTK